MPSLIERFMSKVVKSDGCWLWMASRKTGGYGQFRIGNRVIGAHRVSYEIHNGKITNGLFVCHSCDNPTCVNPDHLFLGTDGDNKSDMYQKGRNVKGVRHPNAKLTVETIGLIRKLSKDGIPQRLIANILNTQRSQVSLIASRKRWASV